MTTAKRLAILSFNLVAGCVLFLISPSFRATVRAKMRGGNDPVNAGEQVVAVLTTDNGKEYVGG
jgi:hypothetical protein